MKKNKFVIGLVVLNLVFAMYIIYLNKSLINNAEKFAKKYDVDYILVKDGVANITAELSGPVIEIKEKCLEYFIFYREDNSRIDFDEDEYTNFHLGIFNKINNFRFLLLIPFFYNLFGFMYFYKIKLSKFGLAVGIITTILCLIGYGLLDGYEYIMSIMFICSSIFVYRSKTVLLGRKIPFWKYI